MALNRPITTIELIQLNKMFSSGRGYKDLIRDFKQSFNIELPKHQAKQFMNNRSWAEVLKWLTGDEIQPDDGLDKIQEIPRQHFELLEQMIKINSQDNIERDEELKAFMTHDWYIPHDTKYFNLPLFGEIITYKWREPFIKCFMFSTQGVGQKRKLDKIEDVPLNNDIPSFLLNIIREINQSPFEVVGSKEDFIKNTNALNDPNYYRMMSSEEIQEKGYKNIFESPLFVKYNIVAKT